MCGIFGIIGDNGCIQADIKILAKHATLRGQDSSGLMLHKSNGYSVIRADKKLTKLVNDVDLNNVQMALGHSRLITDGVGDNQPYLSENTAVFHNGIIVNASELFVTQKLTRKNEIDTEIIARLVEKNLTSKTLEQIKNEIIELCIGIVAVSVALPNLGKLLLFSNNGSLYCGEKRGATYFSSECYPLISVGCENIRKLKEKFEIVDIPKSDNLMVEDKKIERRDLIFGLQTKSNEALLLEHAEPAVKRCVKCILPSTMPFIVFNEQGVCNYCENYNIVNNPKPVEELFDLVKPYRRSNQDDCIVPFSGGRDSCYGLHLVVKELGMKPITYTYDWGMVTDLGRRNISRMCAKLGVENIIIAANIERKRQNIKKNIQAWMKAPHLGMVNLFTAGDKHFFQHVDTVKQQTGINLNLWGINPLETTHFKTGFLGIPPYFDESTVYSTGWGKQIKYQSKRFKEYIRNPAYFNGSIVDNLSGEFYRSIRKKTDYFHIYDYWKWDERAIENTLLNEYDWEMATDTTTSWRIGDGTAAFYNYIFYTVAGFTEHDTFRSNQIREGQLSRSEALAKVSEENKPRYQNLRWYLDTVGLDFMSTIKTINQIPKLWQSNEL